MRPKAAEAADAAVAASHPGSLGTGPGRRRSSGLDHRLACSVTHFSYPGRGGSVADSD